MMLTNGPAAGLGSDPCPALTEPGPLWPPTADPPQAPGARTSGGFTRLREGGRPPAGPRCWVGLGECAAIAQGPRGLAAPLPTARVATLPCAAHRGARSPPAARPAAESASNSVIMLVTSSWVPWCGCLSCSTIFLCLPVPEGVIGAAGFGVWPARDVASFPVAATVCLVLHHRPCAVSADEMTIRGTNGCAHVQGEVRVWPPWARSDPRTQNQ